MEKEAGQDEEIPLRSKADSVCLETGRIRDTSNEGLPQDGISEQPFYSWKNKYAKIGVGEIKNLRILGEEKRKLEQLATELSLGTALSQESKITRNLLKIILQVTNT